MMISTQALIPMTEANQNFSRVVRMVDEQGAVVILKNNKPRYVLVDFSQYDEIEKARTARREKIERESQRILAENLPAFRELAK